MVSTYNDTVGAGWGACARLGACARVRLRVCDIEQGLGRVGGARVVTGGADSARGEGQSGGGEGGGCARDERIAEAERLRFSLKF